MKRIAVLGALLLIMALWAGPAFAQSVPQGSVLPEQQERQTLPSGGGSKTVASVAAQRASARQPALVDTGIELSTGAALAGGLLVVGGGALALSRRRASQR
jgi:LPXTG-motif cell wall-anchored protein